MASARRTERMVELAGLIARREQELARLKAELHRLAEGQSTQPSDGGEVAKPPSIPIAERIMAALDLSTTPLGAPDLCDGFGGEVAVETIRTMLSKLHASGLIARVSHGRYCSWAMFPEGGRRPEGGE